MPIDVIRTVDNDVFVRHGGIFTFPSAEGVALFPLRIFDEGDCRSEGHILDRFVGLAIDHVGDGVLVRNK